MEQFLTYFPSAFSWGNLAVLILGSAGGLFFGAMPGLSPTMAVALLVPFTFYLPADTSLILLGAVYTSAVAGGSISAILLSIPGAPSSIATLFDGYPMAKQGTGSGSPLHRFCKLPYRRRIRRAGHDPVLPPDG